MRSVSLFGAPTDGVGSSATSLAMMRSAGHAMMSGSGSVFGTGIGRAVALMYRRQDAAAAAALAASAQTSVRGVGGGTSRASPTAAEGVLGDSRHKSGGVQGTLGGGGATLPPAYSSPPASTPLVPPMRAVLMIGSAESGPSLRTLPKTLEMPLLSAIQSALRDELGGGGSVEKVGQQVGAEGMTPVAFVATRSQSFPALVPSVAAAIAGNGWVRGELGGGARGCSRVEVAADRTVALANAIEGTILPPHGSSPLRRAGSRAIVQPPHLDGVGLVQIPMLSSSASGSLVSKHTSGSLGSKNSGLGSKHSGLASRQSGLGSRHSGLLLLEQQSSKLMAAGEGCEGAYLEAQVHLPAPPPLPPAPPLPVVELLLRGLNERQVQQVDGLLALAKFLQEKHGLSSPAIEYF